MNVLILGMTESGKTTLAKRLAAGYLRNKTPVLVYDELRDNWPNGAKCFDDEESFMKEFWNGEQSQAVFIDEAADTITNFVKDKRWIQTATRGRHRGHNVHFICQRATGGLARTVRSQVKRIYLFATAVPDCKELAIDFNQEILLEASKLPQGQCITVDLFGGEPRLLNVFKGKKAKPIENPPENQEDETE